jgi:hypothetical protein
MWWCWWRNSQRAGGGGTSSGAVPGAARWVVTCVGLSIRRVAPVALTDLRKQIALAVLVEGGAVWMRRRTGEFLPLVMAGLQVGWRGQSASFEPLSCLPCPIIITGAAPV